MKKLIVLIAIVAFIGVSTAPVYAAPSSVAVEEVAKGTEKKSEKKTAKKSKKSEAKTSESCSKSCDGGKKKKCDGDK